MAKARKSKAQKSKAKKSQAKKSTPKKSKVKKIVKRAAAASSRKAKKSKAPKRAAAKKSAKPAKKAAPKKQKQAMGEGNYEASRKFLKDEAKFVKRHKAEIPQMGKNAEAAMEGPQGGELRAAEQEAMSHSKAPGSES